MLQADIPRAADSICLPKGPRVGPHPCTPQPSAPGITGISPSLSRSHSPKCLGRARVSQDSPRQCSFRKEVGSSRAGPEQLSTFDHPGHRASQGCSRGPLPSGQARLLLALLLWLSGQLPSLSSCHNPYLESLSQFKSLMDPLDSFTDTVFFNT